MLRARVLQCDPEKEKMLLSFKPAAEGDTEEMEKAQFGCEVGTICYMFCL